MGDTQHACPHGYCAKYLGKTECTGGTCVCTKGSDACVAGDFGCYDLCRRDTGGSCYIWNCDSSRGPTVCTSSARCLCNDNFCASVGRCLPKFSTNKTMLAEIWRNDGMSGSNIQVILLVGALGLAVLALIFRRVRLKKVAPA